MQAPLLHSSAFANLWRLLTASSLEEVNWPFFPPRGLTLEFVKYGPAFSLCPKFVTGRWTIFGKKVTARISDRVERPFTNTGDE